MRSNLFQNIAGSSLGVVTDAVIGFFLTRIILHSVGDSSFGLWVLASGLLGYYGLLDLGTRNAVIRFVARHNAQKDYESLSSVVSTALAGYLALGALVLTLACVVAWQLDNLFAFTNSADLADGRELVLVLGVGAAIGFPMNAFGGTLEGMQQFVRIGIVQAGASVSRAIVVVMALRLGYGIVAVGVITVLFNVAAGCVNAAFVLRRFPELRLAFPHVKRSTLVTLASFGLVTFWIGVSNRLRFESDSLVIGNMLGLQMVAMFAIGSKIITYSSDFVTTIGSVFTPMLSHADAIGDRSMVTRMTLAGNKLESMIAFALAALLFFFGRLLIGLWVGPAYTQSYTIITILAIPMALFISHGGATRMLYGVGKHKPLAKMLLVEGVANIVLSVVLARRFGIIGVAWGTAIPLFITSVFGVPWLACRALGISYFAYWRAGQLPALVMVLPLVALFALFAVVLPKPTVGEAAVELVAGACLYAAITFKSFMQLRETFAH